MNFQGLERLCEQYAPTINPHLTLKFSFDLCLNKWIASACGNSTLVVLVPGHHDVALHSPASPPGVLNQPVVLSLVGTITNNKHTMIQPSSAAGPVKKATNAL